MNLRRTPLYDKHVALRARMAPFAGFEMPISYDETSGGTIKEHLAVRQGIGVFDISHMGELWVDGPEATAFLNFVCTRAFDKVAVGQAQYALLLNKRGTIIDDIIAYKVSDTRYWVVVNAANVEKDWKHLFEVSKKFEVKLKNVTDETALIAVQGPKAMDMLLELYPIAKDLKYYGFFQTKEGWVVARTGYTGEDGLEVFLPNKEAGPLWDKFVSKGAVPIGLGARDTLRLEVGFSLYGHELTEDLYPHETGAAFAVKRDHDFIGAASLDKKPRYRPISFEGLNPKPYRQDEKILYDGKTVGWITSGSSSPVNKKGMALGLVEASAFLEWPPKAALFTLESTGKQREAVVKELPFVVTARVKGQRKMAV